MAEFAPVPVPMDCYMDHRYHIVSLDNWHFLGCSRDDEQNTETDMSHFYMFGLFLDMTCVLM